MVRAICQPTYTRYALLLTIACLTLTSCSGTDGRNSLIVGQWVTSGVQLELNPNGSVTSVVNGYRSYGRYELVRGSRKKAVATGIGQAGTSLVLLLLSEDTLQVKSSQGIDGRTDTLFNDTMVLSRAEDDVYDRQWR